MFTYQLESMNHKKVNISITLPWSLRAQIRQAAIDDNRSVSSLVSNLVKTYLHREGYAASGREIDDAARPRQIRMKYR